MSDFSKEDFERMKQTAAEQVMQMHKNRPDMPPFPSFVRVPTKDSRPSENSPSPSNHSASQQNVTTSAVQKSRLNSLLKYINLPELAKNNDSLLLLGLIFLLSSESADEKLILALAYILL